MLLLSTEHNGSQGEIFDDIGLESFDKIETMDGAFATPPDYPYDLSFSPAFFLFLNSVASE